MAEKRVTAPGLIRMKRDGQKIVVLTAYDCPTARLMDQAGIDVLLVGDSVGNAMLGYENTLPVTMDEMVHHVRAVARGASRAMVVADMPFLSYQTSRKDAVANAGRFLKEGGAHAVKLEGGARVAETVASLVDIGIPVMGHLGMTPQSINTLGGYVRQGRSEDAVEALLDDARVLAEAGAFSIVLELVMPEAAERVTKAVSVPTIGIGAGPHCDGQVLVVNDMLGVDADFRPKHARRYLELHSLLTDAFTRYAVDVRSGAFPGSDEG